MEIVVRGEKGGGAVLVDAALGPVVPAAVQDPTMAALTWQYRETEVGDPSSIPTAALHFYHHGEA